MRKRKIVEAIEGRGFMCGPRVYEYEGIVFEIPSIWCPCQLKKNGDPKQRVGKAFYDFYKRFDALPDDEKEKYRIGGGRTRF